MFQNLNFNKLMKLDDSLCFYDKDHLNQKGVVLFNEKFIESFLLPKVSKSDKDVPFINK